METRSEPTFGILLQGIGVQHQPSKNCPVCDNSSSNLVLDHRERVPTLQNVALKTSEAALNFPTGSLKMMWCAKCSFVWNAEFDPSRIAYDASYNNDVSSSDYYLAHLEAMADRIIASVPQDQPIHYVEIGCGEADFLKLVMQRSDGRCVSAMGFDPSYSGGDDLPPGITIHRSFFGEAQLSFVPEATNVICSRHTIEHVADVQAFVGAITKPARQSGRKLFIETPDANWILKRTAFQDFFYEHCSIYTPASIEKVLLRHGMTAQTTSVYGGQYMWTQAECDGADVSQPIEVKYDLALGYCRERQKVLSEWASYIQSCAKDGPVAIWGAASKGVTFSLLLDAEAEIDCAIDLNAAKQGCYLPVTGLPVVSPAEAKQRGVRSIVIMNPNYSDEITDLVGRMEWQARLAILND